ncbi:2-octaprenyl-6-methoxyphenyl hydroxylase [Marinospirillum alkaliphilum]|uniref:2-octaprenyl-6-methoxyphenol hydroxylase n=1 Tax=Marinospirillum alkaliphilum DSM 21637 TaxID=1122209 RepID=A0A1K1WPV0_9GAMM|nr:2-octaprenyl-6-methoxyphenyl hydroxylase [Marinospirillum alkaliphilum]SFX39424.1 2-octaprenyl-6-methoxyphenol hydroxylase [Marinospirillum alkaliphilum DSM 21637]
MQQIECDIAIIGGGLVGASLALALQPLVKQLGLQVCLMESHPPMLGQPEHWQPSFDARSSALSWGTRLIYEQLGLWQDLSRHVYPIKHIHVSDRGYLGSSQLDHEEQQVDALGYVVPNAWLGQVLWQGLQQAGSTRLLAPASIQSVHFPSPDQAVLQGTLDDAPLQLKTRLVVVADGGRSGIKQQLGIADRVHDYEQTALIANVRMSRPHRGWAYERFAADGPMALLPLAGQDMALVWTRPGQQAQLDAALPEAEFIQRLQQSFGKRAGRFQQVGERFAYPLKKVRAVEQVRRNLVVLGNAAHYLHPVAGQGYNLAIRGVMSLAQALQTGATQARAEGQPFHPGDLTLLESWQAQRMMDQDEVIGFSHGLIQLFGSSLPLLGHARAAGLIGLNLLAPARRWLAAKAMGV